MMTLLDYVFQFLFLSYASANGNKELFEAIEQDADERVFQLLEPFEDIIKDGVQLLEPSENTVKHTVKISHEQDCYLNDYHPEIPKTPLLYAIEKRRENIAKMLIRKGASVRKGRPLREAIRYHMEGAVELMLQFDSGVCEHIPDWSTYVHWAVFHENPKILKLICEKCPDLVNEMDKYRDLTPLLRAVLQNHGERVVRTLLHCGADVNMPNVKSKYTTLHFLAGARAGSYKAEVMDVLLSHKDVRVDALDYEGNTPLRVAVNVENEAAFHALVVKGADVNSLDNHKRTIFHTDGCESEMMVALAKSRGFNFESKDEEGNTALLHAAKRLKQKGVSTLAKYGADINAFNNELETAAHSACNSRDPVDWIEFLLYNGFDAKGMNAMKPLDWRALIGNKKAGSIALKRLIEAGMQPYGDDFYEIMRTYGYGYPIGAIADETFQSLSELLLKLTKKFLEGTSLSESSRDIPLMETITQYEMYGVFIFYKFVKGIYEGNDPGKLEFDKRDILAATSKAIKEGVCPSLPENLTPDAFLANNYYALKLEKLAFYFAYFHHARNTPIDVEDAKKFVLNEIIPLESFAFGWSQFLFWDNV